MPTNRHKPLKTNFNRFNIKCQIFQSRKYTWNVLNNVAALVFLCDVFQTCLIIESGYTYSNCRFGLFSRICDMIYVNVSLMIGPHSNFDRVTLTISDHVTKTSTIITSQWHHMSFRASRIIGKSTVCSMACFRYHYRIHHRSELLNPWESTLRAKVRFHTQKICAYFSNLGKGHVIIWHMWL